MTTTTETTTEIEPWRSCFIAFPTLRQACDAIVALHENTAVVKHRCQGIHEYPENPDAAFDVFFALACGDEILSDGYVGEGDFIRAAEALGGTHTGS